MEFLIGYIVGVIIYAIVASIVYKIRYGRGTLQIDHSNPEKDVYRFNMDEKHLDKLSKKTHVILEIDHDADLSQK